MRIERPPPTGAKVAVMGVWERHLANRDRGLGVEGARPHIGKLQSSPDCALWASGRQSVTPPPATSTHG